MSRIRFSSCVSQVDAMIVPLYDAKRISLRRKKKLSQGIQKIMTKSERGRALTLCLVR